MREIKSTCYQRSFTARYMKIVLLKLNLNLSCCEGFNFIFFFPVNVWKGIEFSFPFLSFQCKKLTNVEQNFWEWFHQPSTSRTPPAFRWHWKRLTYQNRLTCTLGSCRSISSLRLVLLDGMYPRLILFTFRIKLKPPPLRQMSDFTLSPPPHLGSNFM